MHDMDTTHNLLYKPYGNDSFSKKVSKVKNLSTVNFGNEKSFYESTTDATYLHCSENSSRDVQRYLKTSRKSKKDNVFPLSYKQTKDHSPEINMSITSGDFDSKNYTKMKINPMPKFGKNSNEY